jgi:hypothetical protein
VSTDKLEGTCSVCLRVIQLRGDRPIRHGFSAIGVRHGAHSGYHTGPCGGSNFPHLGISTEGTAWALGKARDRLATTDESLRELDANPDLIWAPRDRRGLPDFTKSVTLRHGADVPYASDGRPTYAWEHRRRVAELTNVKSELERAIKAYEGVLATWTPEKYAVKGAATKVEIVHLARERKHPRYAAPWTSVACRLTRPGHASDKLKKTTNPAEVTCKQCKKLLGLPA